MSYPFLGLHMFHDSFAFDVDSFLIDELSNPVRICESLFTMNAIFAEMEKLPERAGFFIYQKYIVGYSSKEIAEQEGVTKWAVRSVYSDSLCSHRSSLQFPPRTSPKKKETNI